MSEEQTEYTPESQIETPPIEAEVTPEAAPVEPPAIDSAVLLKKVENLAKENKNLIRSQQAMANQFKTMVDATVKQRLDDLNIARDEAIELGDKQKVREIDQAADAVRQQSRMVEAAPTIDPSIAEFVESNRDWFNKDQEMTDFAVSYNESYLKRNPGNLEESLAETMKKVKQAFPEKFAAEVKEEKKTPPSPVESSARHSSNTKYSLNRLEPEQKIAYEQFVKKHKLMSHDEYFKSLDEAGYLS
jgi:hypothetical protein